MKLLHPLLYVLFFLQSHAQLQTYSLKGELALSGLTSSDVPDDLSSYQSNFLYLPKLSILKQLTSLNGIKKSMDSSYKNFVSYLNLPTFKTLLIVPLNDQIIPRKPLI